MRQTRHHAPRSFSQPSGAQADRRRPGRLSPRSGLRAAASLSDSAPASGITPSLAGRRLAAARLSAAAGLSAAARLCSAARLSAAALAIALSLGLLIGPIAAATAQPTSITFEVDTQGPEVFDDLAGPAILVDADFELPPVVSIDAITLELASTFAADLEIILVPPGGGEAFIISAQGDGLSLGLEPGDGTLANTAPYRFVSSGGSAFTDEADGTSDDFIAPGTFDALDPLPGPAPAGTYSVIILDIFSFDIASVGSVTIAFTTPGAVILAQPQSLAVGLGEPLSFSAEVFPDDAALQWMLDGTPLADGDGVSGATTDTLTIAEAAFADAGVYTLVATAGDDSTTSAEAFAAVKPTPAGVADLDADGQVTVFDLLAYIGLFVSGG